MRAKPPCAHRSGFLPASQLCTRDLRPVIVPLSPDPCDVSENEPLRSTILKERFALLSGRFRGLHLSQRHFGHLRTSGDAEHSTTSPGSTRKSSHVSSHIDNLY